jgi:hypothetical protein
MGIVMCMHTCFDDRNDADSVTERHRYLSIPVERAHAPKTAQEHPQNEYYAEIHISIHCNLPTAEHL